jgi:transposase
MSSNVCHQIIYLAIELSSSSWVIAYRLPANDKAKVHRLEAGDGAGLLAFIASLRHRLDPSDDASTLVVSCFEAGRDGFWLHRLLSAYGVINHVVEPTSILVTRGARRAKTDRLDAFGLLRVLAAKFVGDPDACRIVVVPTVEEEDAKRPHREREFLVQERVRIENRIAALLATQGIRGRPSLRSWDADIRALRTGDGHPLLTHLVAELNRLRRLLSLTLEMIRELDAVREQALEAQHDSASRTVKALCTIRGIGVNFASVLTREVFYRTFDNRRQIASYLGLTPTPFQSGGMDRDRRINRAGNSRARKTLVQLAWLWLPLPTGEQPRGMVPRPCWLASGSNPPHRDRRLGAQALDRNLALRHAGSRTEGGDHRRIEFRRRSISGGKSEVATVFVIGSI